MVAGWFIGDFDPSLLRTKDFEVGFKYHKKDEKWPVHVHKIATEYNFLMKGKMLMRGTILEDGALFIIEANEIANPIFLEDCYVITVKVPSVIGDKYEVDDVK
jgi:hypothetical protein